MFCPKCGSQVQDGARFCPSCGYSFEGRATTAPTTTTPNPNIVTPKTVTEGVPGATPSPDTQAATKPKKKLVTVIAVAAAAVVLCVALGVGLFGQTSGKSTASSTETAQQQDKPDASSSESTDGTSSSSDSSSEKQTSNPERAITVTNVKASQNGSVWTFTATINNPTDTTYDVQLEPTANTTVKDSYGEDNMKQLEYPYNLDVYTDGKGFYGGVVYGLEPGEKRSISGYLYVGSSSQSSSESIDDLDFSVVKVTKSGDTAVSYDGEEKRNDGNQGFAVNASANKGDNGSQLTGTITNNTGHYISEAKVVFATVDSKGNRVIDTIPTFGTTETRTSAFNPDDGYVTVDVKALSPGETYTIPTQEILNGVYDYKYSQTYYVIDAQKDASGSSSSSSTSSSSK